MHAYMYSLDLPTKGFGNSNSLKDSGISNIHILISKYNLFKGMTGNGYFQGLDGGDYR